MFLFCRERGFVLIGGHFSKKKHTWFSLFRFPCARQPEREVIFVVVVAQVTVSLVRPRSM